MSMPRFRSIGFMPTATALSPSLTMAWARTVASGCSVTSDIVGLGGNFTHHLCAHVFELVFEFDFLGNGHTVLGDARCAEGFVDNNVAAFRAKGYFYGIGEDIDAAQHFFAGFQAEFYFFSSHFLLLFGWSI